MYSAILACVLEALVVCLLLLITLSGLYRNPHSGSKATKKEDRFRVKLSLKGEIYCPIEDLEFTFKVVLTFRST